MKKFIILFIGALLLLSVIYLRNNESRVKKTKGSIIIFKSSFNLSYKYEDENDIKTIISVINNAKKINTSFAKVEKEYKETYEIWLQHDNGCKSIYSLWTQEDKSVFTEEFNGTMLISSEDTLKLKELLRKFDD